jgi:hypothetical protein
MATGMVYRGPADVIVVDGRAFHPGDTVPISRERADLLRLHGGHIFGDATKAGDPLRTVQFEGAAPDEALPIGDDGNYMDVKGPPEVKADIKAAVAEVR